MKLGFRRPNGNPQNSGNLGMFIALHVMKRKYISIAVRQLPDGTFQSDTVDHRHFSLIFRAGHNLFRRFAIV